MADLRYYADPMCSWCYGFSPVIEQLAQHHSVELVMGGLRSNTEPLQLSEKREIQHHWQKVQAASGLPFDFQRGLPEGFIYNTEPACRAVVVMAALVPDYSLPFMSRIQEAFYAQAINITSGDELTALAAEFGISQPLFWGYFQSPEIKARVAEHFRQSQLAAVEGFPTLMMQYEGRWKAVQYGYAPIEQVTEKIQALLAGG